jgi:hypothetical protein
MFVPNKAGLPEGPKGGRNDCPERRENESTLLFVLTLITGFFAARAPVSFVFATMAARLLAVAALAVASNAHECLHDALQETLARGMPHEERHLATSAPQEYNFTLDQHGRALQSTTFSSIRIKVDVSRLVR